MNTRNKTRSAGSKPLARLGFLAVAVGLITLPLSLTADPGDESAEKFAERLRRDLKLDDAAFKELVERAKENGGKLELDMEEFEELMEKGGGEREESPRARGGFWGLLEERAKKMRSAVDENEKEHGSVLDEYRPVVAAARNSTVSLVSGRKQRALGTVVDSRGFVVTKASEVVGRDLLCVFPGGVRTAAEVVDVYEPLDLALVRVEADGLEAVKWAGAGDMDLGTFLASPGIGEDPIAIGVVSVASRNLSEKTKGFLGVTPEGSDDGVRLAQVLPGTPAAKAGLKVGDLVLELDGEAIPNRVAFHRMVAGRSPGETVKFKVDRDGKEKVLRAKLVSRELMVQMNGGRQPQNLRIDMMNRMGGKLSENRAGYTRALQTDLTLEPHECGGPVVDLDGKVVGVNIARGGRVKSYAIPSEELRILLGNVGSGKFTITDLSELKRLAAEAQRALDQAEAAMEEARKAKQAADAALEKANTQ